jgi:pimeloyl-ACP methyl ester carboxylesterase
MNRFSTITLLALGSVACTATAPTVQESGLACSALNAGAAVRAQWQAATPELPAHCMVDGQLNPRTGVDGKPYAINFRLRLPQAWNGRFYMSGGGGTNGVLIDPIDTLKKGFATIGTDAGHDNKVHNNPAAGGTASFGVDPQARIDFAYNAYDQVTRTGKSLLNTYYGKQANFSYFEGCSEGGREALLMAQRFPEHYDGIVAGAPTLHLPLGPMAGIHTTQLFANLARRQGQVLANGQAAIGMSMSDADLMLVRESILDACDSLDGIADGIVNNLPACSSALVEPALRKRQCSGAKSAACLSGDQITTLQIAYAGAKNSQGKSLYADWPWDPGVSGMSKAPGSESSVYSQAWRSWWLGSANTNANNAIKLNYVAAVAVAYSSEPVLPFTPADTLTFSLNYNFDKDVDKLYSRSPLNANPQYAQSAAQLYFTDSPQLSGLRDRENGKGGKLLVYHGGADSAISANDTIKWYQSTRAAMGATLPSYARLFLVPGMNHCRGGPATDKFDMLEQVMRWTETGKAPDAIPAHASTPSFFNVSQRSGLLCPYPSISQYKGSGDSNLAHNFECRSP